MNPGPFLRAFWNIAAILAALWTLPSQAGDNDDHAKADARVEAAREKLDAAAAELRAAVVESYSHSQTKHERAFLGILLEHDGDETGVQLSGVTPGGGAAAAGLASGDVLIRVDDVDLVGRKDPGPVLLKVVQTLKPGDVVNLTYRRGGMEKTVEVVTTGMVRSALATIEPKLAPWVEEESFKSITKFMLEPDPGSAVLIDVAGDLAQYFGVERGILIVHVPDLPGGFKAGDLLLSVEEQTPTNASEAQTNLFEGNETRQVVVRRQGRQTSLVINPSDYRVEGQNRVYVYRFDDRKEKGAPGTPETAPAAMRPANQRPGP